MRMKYSDILIKLQEIVDANLPRDKEFLVLEAGCGSMQHVRFRSPCTVAGIDISEKQLERNSKIQQKILGDIQHYDFAKAQFDAIVCWDVLEHLPQPMLALKNFVKTIKDDGLIILAMPNVLSIKGLITKYTPHWFHVFYYRHILGNKQAGKGDIGPFPTFLRYAISANALKTFAEYNELDVVYFQSYDGALTRSNRLVASLYGIIKGVAGILTLNALGDSELVFVLRKQGSKSPSISPPHCLKQ